MVVVVFGDFANGVECVALPCQLILAMTCAHTSDRMKCGLAARGQEAEYVNEVGRRCAHTFDSFILKPSLTKGFKLTILAPSFRSKNMFFRSSFRLGEKTSLFTSYYISSIPTHEREGPAQLPVCPLLA